MSLGGGGMKGFHDGGGGMQNVSLNLTALMDILSNLLFFLLASYSAQAAEVKTKAGMTLPVSSSQASVKPGLTVVITQHEIEAGGEPVAAIEGDKILAPVEDEEKIVPLYGRLRKVKDLREAAGRADAPDNDVVLLLADRNTDSSVIMKVLKTCGMAGFVNVRFGVLPP